MKSKLRGFGLKRSETKEKIDLLPPAQLDELAQAARDMQDMRNCYDSLLFAAAATANSAYVTSISCTLYSVIVFSIIGYVDLYLLKHCLCNRDIVSLGLLYPQVGNFFVYFCVIEFPNLTPSALSEFSESLREMGSCLLEKTALHDDEESGKVLLMLGNVQFELQKLVDSYRSHIFLTITNPSESLLNELRTVELQP